MPRPLFSPIILFLPFLLASALITAPVAAQSADDPDIQQSGGFVIVGAAALPEFFGADDLRPVPLVVSRFEAFGVDTEIEGLRARFNLLGTGSVLRIGPALSVTLPRNDTIINEPIIEALGGIDLALELGGFVGFEIPFSGLKEGRLNGNISFRHDVLGAHGGFLVTPELDYFFAVNRMLRFNVGVNASYGSRDFTDTYFSVSSAGSALTGLAEFDAGSGFTDVGGEVFSILSFSPRWGAFTRFAYNRLLSDPADSPIVTDVGAPNQFFVGAGVFYRF